MKIACLILLQLCSMLILAQSQQMVSSYGGEYIYAINYQGYLYRNTMMNITKDWTNTNLTGSNVLTSKTGLYVYLAATDSLGCYLLRSINYGVTFSITKAYIAYGTGGKNLHCDGSGKYIIACYGVYSANAYLSSDYGISFTKTSAPTTYYWGGIGMDSSGSYIALPAFGTGIMVSKNRGISWSNNAPSSGSWSGTSISSTGQYMVATQGRLSIITNLIITLINY